MERAIVLFGFAVLGFALGVAASIFYPVIKPYLLGIPAIFASQWFLSGLVGALFSVIVVAAYLSATNK
ncbi:hypothetical protein B9Q13_02810 [Candidatus Marsarchaeota G2 archaeon ECH_B_SAG-G16]|uniref:Major facilitator superfamily (MFS) profile domain-containing protein n=1 Tax=Candidatus Marsarchaeota G2 archaeon ECH_B_SAG-G16 TaxID=1978167 RepID=A0A2R6C2J3_9ARCH|nr:MAG: hypothetical protein B9Q13_02810 [Candidatus Marsarchaeota G2 archaeon ECH_B_SAG-G16]